jgi:glycosyltransferase involved in cell wall biosynthesis
MSKSAISVVIPHKNRQGLLKWHLDELSRQSFKDFEIIVADDHSHELPVISNKYSKVVGVPDDVYGPAAARNHGAEMAESDIILFVGDDCIPDRDLLFRHYYMHERKSGQFAVQGFSPFHPHVMSTEFMYWLDNAGLQARWRSLINDDGTPKEDATGFCLTTNYSINKQLFLDCGGFDSYYFRAPAWEDVSLGYVLMTTGVQTYFDIHAINYHYHHYNIESFAKRQHMVGKNALGLCLKHSEWSEHSIVPDQLRAARLQELDEWLHNARLVTQMPTITEDINKSKGNIWGQTIHLAMMKGVLDDIDERGTYFQVFEHLHKKESVVHALEGIRGIIDDNYGWSMHNVQWLIKSAPDNWAIWAYAGELFKHYGMMDDARAHFNKSLELAPNEWASENTPPC